MADTILTVKVNSLKSALLAQKAGAYAIIPLEGLGFEDLRAIRGSGLVLFEGPAMEGLSEKQIRYLDFGKVPGNVKLVSPASDNAENAYWSTKVAKMSLDGIEATDSQYQWAYDAMLVTEGRLEVGTVEKILSDKAVIKFSKPVALHDVLCIDGRTVEVSEIEGLMSFIPQGRAASIAFPPAKEGFKPKFGSPVYCVHRHNLGIAETSESCAPYKAPLDIEIAICDTGLCVNGMAFEVEMQESKSQSDIAETLSKVFASSGESLFTLGELSVKNTSSFEWPFVPMSVLKQIRRAFYEAQDAEFKEI